MKTGRIIAFLAGLMLSAALLAGSVFTLGTNSSLMLRLMRSFTQPGNTGLPAQEYPAVAQMTADYLAGSTNVFQHTFSENGATYRCFNAEEQLHMADCRSLFTQAKWLAVGCGILSVALIALLRRRAVRNALLCGAASLPAAGILLFGWALVDFDGLFILFHRIAFSNMLWLMDPSKDLIVRLMPTPFFTTYAALILVCWLLLCCIAAFLIGKTCHSD